MAGAGNLDQRPGWKQSQGDRAHIWDVVEWEIYIMEKQQKNWQQLCIDAFMWVWTKIWGMFQRLFESVPQRIKALLKAKGVWAQHQQVDLINGSMSQWNLTLTHKKKVLLIIVK